MKIIFKRVVISSLFAVLSTSVLAGSHESTCYVVGYHQPGTHIYNGPTICPNIILPSLTVRGPLELNQTIVNGIMTVSGPIKANGAKLQEIVVKENWTVETITLQSETTVYGNIDFKGNSGIVYLEEGSFIKGKVINGKVIHQEKNRGKPE